MADKVWCYFILPRNARGEIRQLRARLKVIGDCVTLHYQGQDYKYFWDPSGTHVYFLNDTRDVSAGAFQPVTAKQLYTAMDQSFLKALTSARDLLAYKLTLWERVQRLFNWHRPQHYWVGGSGNWTDGSMCESIAKYIEEHGVAEGEFIVITKKMLEDIRKGGSKP